MQKSIDETKCNNYIQDLDEIKDALIELDYYWVEDFDEIEEVYGGFLSGEASEEDIQDAIEEVRMQSERLLEKLGIDPEDILTSKKETPTPLINISPTFTQQQTTQISTQIDIDMGNLVKEFETELSKPHLDKSKLKSMLETLLKHGIKFAPKIIEIIIRYIDKILN